MCGEKKIIATYLLTFIHYLFFLTLYPSIPSRVILKTFKMVLNISLLNTQQYKVRMKDKVEQTRERSSALPSTSV